MDVWSRSDGSEDDPVGKLSDRSVIKKKKIRKVGRFWSPSERHHFGTPRPRYLVFFEIRNFFEELQNFPKFKIWEGRWISVASGRALVRVPAWPVSRVLWNSCFWKKYQNFPNFKIREGRWMLVASGMVALRAKFWRVPFEFWNLQNVQKNKKNSKSCNSQL